MQGELSLRPVARRAPAERGLTMAGLWAVVACVVPAAAMLLPPLRVVDVAYGVRAGNLMLDAHELVRTDPFGLATARLPWLNQQWLAQIAMALVYRSGGWELMVFVRALLSGAVFSLVYASCRAAGAAPRRAAILTLGGFMLAIGHDLRAELFGLVLLSGTVWLVTVRGAHPRLLWFVPVAAIAWANLHGSFVLAPLLLGLAYLEDRSSSPRSARRTLGVLGLTVLGTAVTPWGPGVWPYALGLSTNGAITDTIAEWQPTTLRSTIGIVFFLSLGGLVVLLARRTEPVPVTTILALGIFLAGGLWAIRGVAWWGVVAPVLVAPLLPAPRPETRPDPRSRLNAVLALGLLVLGLVLLPWWRTSDRPPGTLLRFAPTAITEHLRTHVPPGARMFNPQIWGSWFELELPGRPTFVDARIEVVPDAVWRDYDAISAARSGWEEIVDRWGFDVIVAARSQQAPLIEALSGSQGWRIVYEDGDGVLYLRSP